MKTVSETVAAIQDLLHESADGIWGNRSDAALRHLLALPRESPWPQELDSSSEWHHVKASSFADPADVAAFRKCKAAGNSDQFCFGKGDNGVGKWGDDCTVTDKAFCALPPEMWSRYGAAARGKHVIVKIGDKEVVCELRDTMPHLVNIKNGAGIDLAPGAAARFGLKPPFMVQASWKWEQA